MDRLIIGTRWLFAGAAIVAIALLAGCGDSAGGPSTSTTAVSVASPSCDLGGVSPLRIARVGGPIVRKSPVRILACGSEGAGRPFYIVGFDTNHGTCLSLDRPHQGKTYGVYCRAFGATWMELCEKAKAGCLLRYMNEDGRTLLLGIVPPQVRKLEASVRTGAPADLALAQVDSRLQRLIDRREAVGFVAASLPGCVPVGAIRLTTAAAEGKRLGAMPPYNGSVTPCGKAG